MRTKKDPNLKLSSVLAGLKEQGRSFRTLSKRVSIPASTLSEWANGSTPTDHQALKRLAVELGFNTVDELLFGQPPKTIDVTTTLNSLIEQSIKKDVFHGKFEIEIKINKIRGE